MEYKCKKQSVCSVPACGKKHSRFIHVDPVPQTPVVPQVTSTSNLSAGNSGAGNNGAHAAGNSGNMAASGNVSSVSATCHKGNAYLPIVPVIVNGYFIVHYYYYYYYFYYYKVCLPGCAGSLNHQFNGSYTMRSFSIFRLQMLFFWQFLLVLCGFP